MQDKRLTSVGIDIGTSTTQCAFSSMRLRNAAPAFAVPRIQIEDKQILYRAPARLTPLLDADTIDAEGVRALVRGDYRAAQIDPSMVQCGAVIITGETARKKNARAVAEALAGFAGDFVVAAAGPDLEAVLAGKGAGAAALSQARRCKVLNLDIGGGTTNICLFDAGEPALAGCMNVGGRLVRRDESGRVRSFTDTAARIARDAGVELRTGGALSEEGAARIARRMAELLEEGCGLRERTELHDQVLTEHDLPADMGPDLYTFSGGVAECVYERRGPSPLFDDIGYLLGAAVARSRFFTAGRVLRPAETQNATVIGAGAYTVNVSGSTIRCPEGALPLRGLPVARVRLSSPEDIPGLEKAVRAQRRMVGDPCAIGFEGLDAPNFQAVEQVAQALCQALEDQPLPVIVMARDMAKALGQAMARRRGGDIVCLDGVALEHGDTIDIGAALMGARVVPVVVKTLF